MDTSVAAFAVAAELGIFSLDGADMNVPGGTTLADVRDRNAIGLWLHCEALDAKGVACDHVRVMSMSEALERWSDVLPINALHVTCLRCKSLDVAISPRFQPQGGVACLKPQAG